MLVRRRKSEICTFVVVETVETLGFPFGQIQRLVSTFIFTRGIFGIFVLSLFFLFCMGRNMPSKIVSIWQQKVKKRFTEPNRHQNVPSTCFPSPFVSHIFHEDAFKSYLGPVIEALLNAIFGAI